jgi:hypothetical protein
MAIYIEYTPEHEQQMERLEGIGDGPPLRAWVRIAPVSSADSPIAAGTLEAR